MKMHLAHLKAAFLVTREAWLFYKYNEEPVSITLMAGRVFSRRTKTMGSACWRCEADTPPPPHIPYKQAAPCEDSVSTLLPTQEGRGGGGGECMNIASIWHHLYS